MTGTITIRDIVIHMGNDFFQSCMTTSSLAEPQSYQCELKQKPFARIFLEALFCLTFSVSAFAVTLKARPAEQFLDFR